MGELRSVDVWVGFPSASVVEGVVSLLELLEEVVRPVL